MLFRSILDRLNNELIAVLKKPDVRDLFNSLAFQAAGESREEFRRYMVTELAKWVKAVKDSGTKID